ncbi:DnaJ homolog subfamily B member 9 [Eumeta japonica]|uniref:DnaJ homolog subfamily B member 9 n=1 Tax=Eumeta variegata TaxID=151549 RepID=A0A4C1ZF80_EUMVA|nr:DnaJ homolog subfamily B member 9 [Eumeta japonica]
MTFMTTPLDGSTGKLNGSGYETRLNVIKNEMLSQRVGKPWLVQEMVRNVTSSVPAAASHYDVLGISPKATHNDIKSAYYKLSMLHHPDKSSDELSVRKFRAITEAYEILGNANSKRLYDKTLAHGLRAVQVVHEPAEESQDPVVRFHHSRMNRHMTATIHGKTPIYDFDACYTTLSYTDAIIRTTNRDQCIEYLQV